MNRWPKHVLAALVALAFTTLAVEAETSTGKTVHTIRTQRVSSRHFRAMPVMTRIPSTAVFVAGGPSFDLYRYAGRWYLVEENAWYRARTWRGPFVSIAADLVPRRVSTAPPASIAVGEPAPGRGPTLSREPHMAAVGPDSRVLYSLEETDHDLYRLSDTWYRVRDGRWFSANSWRGPYRPIPFESAPAEIRAIPAGYRKHWVAPGTPVPGTNGEGE